ncbi:putative amino acid permease YhdG [Legionella massiliensis]|uniref:Putative amino acid permease YhdG n=1 Tax=Legionella massiliensis TaxID=1034943 RepID=A0A078KP39_9GAMM|nr:amino acid permease [Legionella massiliensis]CDZ76145.1 putative amino acid permease YhdG [Legionella massiliensis]CEE11883.1 putative amino acid permease YhdG [Legionella massiliensis]
MDLFRKKDKDDTADTETNLVKCLSSIDLLLLGVGAIIGAGIFVLTGIVAANDAGPAIVLSYVVAGFACAFAALSYAELAASIGGCGSAYGYAYAGFGELIAWIVGWDLLLEYSISVSAVSVGWSSYFNDFLTALKLYVPTKLHHDGGLFNLSAFSIIIFLMVLLGYGVKSSSRFNNTMVLVKLAVILLFIVIASTAIKPQYWSPFMPFGWSGVMHGASLIFFAYIGFDAVSTAAEEAVNPQRDIPVGIVGSLLICTVLYIIVSGLLTGIAPYSTLNVSSPISYALLNLGYKFAAGMVGVGAIAGLTTVMLVLFYGLSRIFLAMARDGLLPRFFSQVNGYTKTPLRIIVTCGLFMALLAAFVPMHDLAELVNIGTLFAFITVCAGVIILRYTQPDMPRPFKTPLMPLIPALGIISCSYLIYNLPGLTMLRFIIWMAVGLVIYFSYSRHRSELNLNERTR